MNFKTYIFHLTFAAVLISLCPACQDTPKEFPDTGVFSLNVYASIEAHAESRAVTSDKVGDEWSFTDFSIGDEMGFYSSGGNMNINDGLGPFENQKLIFNGSSFNDPEDRALFSPTHMKENEVFLYFPYCETSSEPGIPLRRQKDSQGPDRCIDLIDIYNLTIFDYQKEKAALFGTMQHAFSEIIVVRGEGFDNPPSDDPKYQRITVVLSNPYTHFKITAETDPSWSLATTLVYDATTSGLSSDQAKRWDAWKGLNFGSTQTNPEGDPAWYVVLPTLPGSFSNVDYIELYDNEGYLQRVSSLRLYGQTKTLQPGHRYPLKIIMKELVPTVNPFPILPWENEVNLTDERKRGVNSLTDFSLWVRDYNTYLADKTDVDKENALLKYGDKIINEDESISWHFYLLSDLDLTNYTPLPYLNEKNEEINDTSPFILQRLEDVLDGKSTTFVNGSFINHNIYGLSKTFVGVMEGSSKVKASLQNLSFLSPNIKFEDDNSQAAGILANSIKEGSVLNCNIINGTLFNRGGPIGCVAGSISNGKVSDCIFSGSLTGSSTSTIENSRLIIGTTPVNSEFSNNDVSNLTSNLQE